MRTHALILTLCLVATSHVFAQEESAIPASAPEMVQTETMLSEDGLVSLDFREADIRNVLKILSMRSGMNIVAGPEVVATVSIQLTDVPWQEALDVILQTYGYGYEQRGKILMVTTIEDLKKRREDAMILADQQPLETQIFPLNFATAGEVVSSLEAMISDRGSVQIDERTNTVIVTDTGDKLKGIKTVVERLDETTPQVLIEAKIVETTFSDTDNLGIDWVTQVSLNGASRPTTFPFASNTSNKYLSNSFPAAESADFSFGTLSFSQVQAVFEALKTRSDTNILSSPRIVTLDNQPAQITVGSQYPVPTYTYNEDQAALQVSGWEYMDIGIIFDTTPHVNNAGFVTLEIEPKITSILDFVTVENTSLPRLSNESATTTVLVKDGETLVIAGLVKDQVTETRKRVPFLGDIPVLGYVFQKKANTTTKTDLMIFMTPHIITPDVDSDS
jgi:type IV pilus assembly protein PilQ